jgi:putative peptidoglycan lipid II flippase
MGKFARPAFAPILLNAIWIGALAFVIPKLNESLDIRITALSWAILLAGVIQMIFQMIPLWQGNYRPHLSINWQDSRLKETLRIFVPAAAANSIRYINSLIDVILALWIGAWAPAALVFAERLAFLPLGLFATAMGTVLLPELSRLAVKEQAIMKKTLEDAICSILIIMVPAAAGLAYLATPIIQLIYEQGAFDAESTRFTSRALMAYAPGLVTFSLYKMLLPAFHAQKDTRTPMISAGIAVILNIFLNLLFIQILPLHWRHAGLAFATVIASIINTLILIICLRNKAFSPNWLKIGITALRISICTAAMIAVILAIQSHTSSVLETKQQQIINMITLIGAGIITYVATMLILCRREILALQRRKTLSDIP